MDQDRRPVQDIAGVAGGGLEEERDRTPSVDTEPRGVADDRPSRRKIVDELNDNEVAPPNDDTRTITNTTTDRKE